MEKILVFTDLHLVPAGETIIGLDPAARFAEGLTHALDHHGDATRIVLCGDLAHTAAAAEYERLATLLADCPLPVSMIPGNHDRRAPLRAAFPDLPVTASGHIQTVVDLDAARLILLDTLDEAAPDRHSGWLCPDRLDWLDAALDGAAGAPVVIFTHHPPFLTGFDGMDAIGLRNRADLLARLHGRNVALIVSGHIHRTIFGAAGGIPAAVLKSPCHQMPLRLGPAATTLSVDEPGAYGILLLGPEGPVLHSADFTLPEGNEAHYEVP